MAEQFVRYVFSAHGSDDKSSEDTLSGGKMLFYVKEGEIYQSSNHYQTLACKGRTIPQETIHEGDKYPSSMYFTRDAYRNWMSGLKDCYYNQIVYNLDSHPQGISFKSLIDDVLKPYHDTYHPGKKFELHILTCRVCITSTEPAQVKIVTAHKGKDRSQYIKPKQVKEQGQITATQVISDPAAQVISDPAAKEKFFYKKYLKYKAKYQELKKLIPN